ncbi:MAG: glycosyltransferase family 2 protein [Nitrospirota bacterium]
MKIDVNWRRLFGLKPKILAGPPCRQYTITVVIPAYNEERNISDTIDSIRSQSVYIDEIIVVDDCSTDRTGEIALEKGVRVVRTHQNQGTKAMAQNYVINDIHTDLMVSIDADTILHKKAIENTLPYFNDPLTAAVCGFVIPQRIETLWERGRFIEYILGLTIFKSAQNSAGTILVCSGCFAVFSTKHIQKMGGFQPRTMGEDMDLTWDFLLNGFRIYYAPNALCYPLDPPTFAIFKKQVNRWYRSFFQNISVHSFRKNKKLGTFVYGYLLDSFFSPLLALSIYLVTSDMLYTLGGFLMIEIFLVAIVCLITGFRIRMVGKVISSLWAYFIIKPVNYYMFLKAMWKEWIAKERLMVWEKGH